MKEGISDKKRLLEIEQIVNQCDAQSKQWYTRLSKEEQVETNWNLRIPSSPLFNPPDLC
jgi:hypothetical protein